MSEMIKVARGNDSIGDGDIFILPAHAANRCTILKFISDNGERKASFALPKWELKKLLAELIDTL